MKYNNKIKNYWKNYNIFNNKLIISNLLNNNFKNNNRNIMIFRKK